MVDLDTGTIYLHVTMAKWYNIPTSYHNYREALTAPCIHTAKDIVNIGDKPSHRPSVCCHAKCLFVTKYFVAHSTLL